MIKKKVVALIQLMLDNVKNLSDDQVEKLLSGGAIFTYTELTLQNSPNDGFLEELRKAEDIKQIEKLLKPYTKKELLSLSKNLQVETKSSDTKAELYRKIASYFGKVFILDVSNDFNEIQNHLENINDIKTGQSYINNHTKLKTKVSLIKLAKSLNVYVNPKNKKEEIQARIVESIVGARLRAKGIRER